MLISFAAAKRLGYAVALGLTVTLPVQAEQAIKLPGQLAPLLRAEARVLAAVPSDYRLTLAGVSDLKPKPKPKVLVPATIPDKAQLRKMPKATGGSEWACLTEALYFEARGESVPGIFAVAEVIVNRKKSKRFPSSVCAVISQGAHRRNACQFSYKCDGRAEVYGEQRAYEMVGKIAAITLQKSKLGLTNGATYYHSTAVRPKWSRKFARTTKIGKHFFYRPS